MNIEHTQLKSTQMGARKYTFGADITSLTYFAKLPPIIIASVYGRVISVHEETSTLSKEILSSYADNV